MLGRLCRLSSILGLLLSCFTWIILSVVYTFGLVWAFHTMVDFVTCITAIAYTSQDQLYGRLRLIPLCDLATLCATLSPPLLPLNLMGSSSPLHSVISVTLKLILDSTDVLQVN